jgi:hypothetical protein
VTTILAKVDRDPIRPTCLRSSGGEYRVGLIRFTGLTDGGHMINIDVKAHDVGSVLGSDPMMWSGAAKLLRRVR